MELRVARIHHPIEVLGPGRRVGVWLQGCSIRCRGCMSKDTWEPTVGEGIATEVVASRIFSARDSSEVSGLTVSGGEPFDQAAGLEHLLELVRAGWPEADILVYSGYSHRQLRTRYPRILSLLDALMAGPYVEGRDTELPWRGSANQELVLLSAAATESYRHSEADGQRRLQVGIDQESVWIAGIPRRGDLARLRDSLESQGLLFEEVSWST